MRVKHFVMLAITLLALNSEATETKEGAFFSGNDLNMRCRYWDTRDIKDEHIDAMNLCAGYVAGVADASQNVCLPQPPSATVDQAVSIVKSFMEKNPQILHYSAASVVDAVLSRVFPCHSK